jgi:hypothetical protein
MTEGKDFWHDVRVGITKELIIKAVIFVLGLPVVLVVAATLWHSIGNWLLGDSHMLHWAVLLLVWLLLIAFAVAARLAYMLQRERATRSAATPAEQPRASVKFAPETFDLSPARSRALLVLRQRVDARTTLHDLFQLVTDQDDNIDARLTKAQLQHDMEAAERAGIVSIERLGTLTQYHNLTIPAGRDWVLTKQNELQSEAKKGMTRKAQRPRYF